MDDRKCDNPVEVMFHVDCYFSYHLDGSKVATSKAAILEALRRWLYTDDMGEMSEQEIVYATVRRNGYVEEFDTDDIQNIMGEGND